MARKTWDRDTALRIVKNTDGSITQKAQALQAKYGCTRYAAYGRVATLRREGFDIGEVVPAKRKPKPTIEEHYLTFAGTAGASGIVFACRCGEVFEGDVVDFREHIRAKKRREQTLES